MRVLLLALAATLLAPSVQAQMAVEYYHLDAVGSVLAITDESGALVEEHDYDVFGQEVGAQAGTQPKRFAGKERDGETGWDYFGARYYGSKIGRFTTTDPVYTWRENLFDPQRWNRYAYARNNPLRYVDPDGREVRYANGSLQTFFGFLSGRSAMVRDTLAQYTGPGRPDLLIRQGDPGREEDGGRRNGAFTATDFHVVYPDTDAVRESMRRATTAEDVEDLGTWTAVGATITLGTSLQISVGNKNTVGTALHELGHADHAVRRPLEYMRQSRQRADAKGKPISWADRAVEKTAESYRSKAELEVKP